MSPAVPKPKRIHMKRRWDQTGFVAPKVERVRDPEYLRYLRTLPCAVCTELGEHQTSRTQAHHTRSRGAFGGDDGAVNICSRHHKAFHLMGRKTFKEKYRVDLFALARELWALWQRAGTWSIK